MSSSDRHLISRSPGINSFFVASNCKLARLNSTGSVTNSKILGSSLGGSIKLSRLGCLSLARLAASFFRIAQISSFYVCVSFFFSRSFFSNMNTDTSMLFLSFFFAR